MLEEIGQALLGAMYSRISTYTVSVAGIYHQIKKYLSIYQGVDQLHGVAGMYVIVDGTMDEQ